MDNLISFLDQLEANGIEISGRERIAALVGECEDLPRFIVSVAEKGHQSGIVFALCLAKLNAPALNDLMSKHGFTREQQTVLMGNSGVYIDIDQIDSDLRTHKIIMGRTA